MSMATSVSRTVRASLVRNEKVVFVESLVVLMLVWSLISHLFGLEDTISSPMLVGTFMYDLLLSMEWVTHVGDTIRRTLYGFTVTMIFGTVFGVFMGWNDFWEKTFQDFVFVVLAIPSLFAAVFAAMWFGVSDFTPTAATSIVAFPFVTLAIYQGAKNIDAGLIEMSRSFNVSNRRVFRRVVFQSILPEWFSGARYAFALCWKVTTLAELLAAESGIGYMIAHELELLNLTGIMGWTTLFLIVILVVEYGVFQQIEKRVFEWRESDTIAWA